MKILIKILQFYGYWTSKNDGNHFTSTQQIYAVATSWVILPALFFCYNQMSHVRLVMKTSIELMVIVKYVIHMASLYGYRSKLELAHRELEAALKPISGDEVQEEEVHDFRRRLHRVTDLIIKWYFNVECVVIVVYCFIPPTIVIVQYAATGVVPPLSNLIESELVGSSGYLFFKLQRRPFLSRTVTYFSTTSPNSKYGFWWPSLRGWPGFTF